MGAGCIGLTDGVPAGTLLLLAAWSFVVDAAPGSYIRGGVLEVGG